MTAIPWQSLAARANADGEFQQQARLWNATLRFDVGTESRALRIEDGRIRSLEPCASDAPCDVFVSAAPEEWERLLAPAPRPFYHDLFGAYWRHGFRMNEDMTAWAAYYPALRRLVEILREAKGA